MVIRGEDQILINTHQLGVLVGSRKEGDEVKLTLVRGGKVMTVRVKLGTQQVPKRANAFFYRRGDGSGAGMNPPQPPEAGRNMASWPGMGPDDTKDVLRMIEHERGNLLVGPGVRIMGRAGMGSTIVDRPKSNISYSDDDGAIEIKVDDGKRHLTVRNAKGEVMFNGPINTAEERAKLPPEVSKQWAKLESNTFNIEVNEDFRPETIPLLPAPEKAKMGLRFDREAEQPAAPGPSKKNPARPSSRAGMQTRVLRGCGEAQPRCFTPRPDPPRAGYAFETRRRRVR